MTKCNRLTIRGLTTAVATLLFAATIALSTTTLGYPSIAGADLNNGAAQAEAANIQAPLRIPLPQLIRATSARPGSQSPTRGRARSSSV